MTISSVRKPRRLLLLLVRMSPLLFGLALLAGCATVPTQQSGGSSAGPPPLIEESLKNIGIASPRSLLAAESTLADSTSGYSASGLELSYVVYKMIQILYPLYLKQQYVIYPPTASIYPELFKKVQNGEFPSVDQNNVSFLTLIIPPMAVLYSDNAGVIESSLEALNHAESLNPNSVLPPYLKGVIAEKRGNTAVAVTDYKRALAIDSSCYPAAIGEARILIMENRFSAATAILDRLVATIPPDAKVFLLQAEAQYALGYYAKARESVGRSLALSPHDAKAVLLAARTYAEEKQYAKALEQLDALAKLQKPTPKILLMRANLEQEAGHPGRSLEVLAGAVRSFPGDKQLAMAYGKALVAAGDASAGSKYLSQNQAEKQSGADSLELLVTDAIHSENWKAAATYVTRLLELRSNERTLGQAYTIYSALGDTKKVVQYARKLHEAAPKDQRYLVDYVESLIAAGDPATARTAIDGGLAATDSPAMRSRLFYLRSTIAESSQAELRDLRRALLENLENEKALIAMARYYLRGGDLGSARRYAGEAQAFLAPGKKLPEDLAKIMTP